MKNVNRRNLDLRRCFHSLLRHSTHSLIPRLIHRDDSNTSKFCFKCCTTSPRLRNHFPVLQQCCLCSHACNYHHFKYHCSRIARYSKICHSLAGATLSFLLICYVPFRSYSYSSFQILLMFFTCILLCLPIVRMRSKVVVRGKKEY